MTNLSTGVRRPCPPPYGHGRAAGPRGDGAAAGRAAGRAAMYGRDASGRAHPRVETGLPRRVGTLYNQGGTQGGLTCDSPDIRRRSGSAPRFRSPPRSCTPSARLPGHGDSRTRPRGGARSACVSPCRDREGKTRMPSVLVVDDQFLIRSGLVALLNAAPGYEIAGEAADGEEAVRLAAETRPVVVLMDIRMPGTDGITATPAHPRRRRGPCGRRAQGPRPDHLRLRRVRLPRPAGRRQRLPRQGHPARTAPRRHRHRARR